MAEFDKEPGIIVPMPKPLPDPHIRLACLSHAVDMHSAVHGPKDSEAILKTAKEFLAWVLPETSP